MECVSMETGNPLTLLRFEAAVKVIKSLPPDGSFQPSNDMMLKFYSYFKQATLGPCNIPRPGFWDAVGKAKWDAWNSLGDMAKEEAMAAYVNEMKLILEGMPITDEVEELLKVMGPFYELVDEKKRITQISDLSSGFGTMLSSRPSKSVTKSIIRNMELNGSLESRPTRTTPQLLAGEPAEEEKEDEDDDDDEEDEEDDEDEEAEEVETYKVKKDHNSNKKAPSRRSKDPLSHGKMANGGPHLTHRPQPKAALNGHDGPQKAAHLNGHSHPDSSEEPAALSPANDSDSEVYCDSVDQFGQEEESQRNHSPQDLDLDQDQGSLSPTPEEETQTPPPGELPGPEEGVQRGGEEGEASRGSSQRQSHSGDTAGRSQVRGGRASRPSGGAPSERPGTGGRPGDQGDQGDQGAGTPPRRDPEPADRGGSGTAAGGHAERPAETDLPGGTQRHAGEVDVTQSEQAPKDPVLVALPRLPRHRGLGSGLAVRGAVAPPLVPPEKEKKNRLKRFGPQLPSGDGADHL